MPGITAALHPSWPVDATSIHHRSQRPSLPPLSPCTPSRRSTLDLQEYHHDARTKQQQQPGMSRLSTGFAWPTRRSSPPSTLATDRHLGAYPHLHSQDLDIPALWSPVQSPYASPVHSSPTSSNGTDGDWSDASTDFIQPHASTACKPSTYALNVSLGPADIAKTSAHTPYGRQPGYVSRAQLDQWEQQNARDGSGQIQAPAYSVDNLPKYRATEAVVRDDGHEEANRISNADFARRYVMPVSAVCHVVRLRLSLILWLGHTILQAGKTGDTSELIDRFARLQTKSSGYTPARGMPLPVTPAQDPVVIKASTNDALYARSFLPPTYSAATLLRDDQYDYYSYLLGQSPALPLVSAPSVDIPSAGAGALPPCKKKESLYKTELCRGYEERGHCDYGAKWYVCV